MKKIAALSFCVISLAGCSSSPLSDTVVGEVTASHQGLNKSSYEEGQGRFLAYWGGMPQASSIDEYRTIEKGYLKLIYEVFPNLRGYWNDVYSFGDMKVVQADSLIDLQRIRIEEVQLGARMHDYTSQYSVRQSDGALYPELMNSHLRMKSGLAPVGPDNEPLVLCRLHDSPRASYFEMAEIDAWRLLNALGSGMTLEQACMEDDVVPGYWKKRIETLIDGRGRITRSKRDAYQD